MEAEMRFSQPKQVWGTGNKWGIWQYLRYASIRKRNYYKATSLNSYEREN